METSAGVSRFAEEKFTNYTSALGRDLLGPAFQDRSGTVWSKAAGSLAVLLEGKWGIYAPNMAPLFDYVSSIYQDRSGAVRVTVGCGLWRLDHGKCDLYASASLTNLLLSWTELQAHPAYVIHTNALPGQGSPLGILEDHQGNLWVGSHAGLHRFRDGQFTSLTTSNGLSSDFVGPLLADPDGTLWIGSDKGLNRLKDGHVTRYTTAHGLAENIVANLLEDDAGWFWTMGHHGIHRMRKQDLNDLAEGKRPRIQTISYGEADGMLSSEGNVGVFPNTCQTADGLLWFPTTRGVVVIEPHEMATHDRPPPVVIEQILADNKLIFGDDVAEEVSAPDPASQRANEAAKTCPSPAPAPTGLRLAPGRARGLEFRFTANTFVAPEKVRFRFKLDGHDADWQEAGTRRTAFYTDLAPGAYRFRVLAINHHGIESAAPAEFAFSLAPFFYQTDWFYAASALGILLSAWGLHRLRVGILGRHQALEQQLALALQRERIAKDMHDDLGASLTQISLLTEHARRDPTNSLAVAADVEKIAQTARHTAEAAEEIVWTVNPRHDSLDSLATYLCQLAREQLESTDIRLRLEMPEPWPTLPLPSDVRHNLVLFVKEAIHNVIKHSGAHQVTVGLSCDHLTLVVTVADDGHGLLAAAEAAKTHRHSSGNGLINMRQRIESIGGQFQVRSQPGKGTTVAATVRLRKP
jgi:signal transduction histidine kinase